MPSSHQEYPVFEGSVQILGLQAILRMLAMSEKTGILQLFSQEETILLSFHEGKIVDIQSSTISLHQIALLLATLSDVPVEQAAPMLSKPYTSYTEVLEIFIQNHWLSRESAAERHQFFQIQIVSHALQWDEGHFLFHPTDVALSSLIEPFNIELILLDALRHADEWTHIAATQGYILYQGSAARWKKEITPPVMLSQEQMDILHVTTGEYTLSTFAATFLKTEAEVARILQELLFLHCIEICDTSTDLLAQQHTVAIIQECYEHLALQIQTGISPVVFATMTEALNNLVSQFELYQKGMGIREASLQQMDHAFVSAVYAVQQRYPICRFVSYTARTFHCPGLLTLDTMIKGRLLYEYIAQGMEGLHSLLYSTLQRVLQGETHTTQAYLHLQDMCSDLMANMNTQFTHSLQAVLFTGTSPVATPYPREHTTRPLDMAEMQLVS